LELPHVREPEQHDEGEGEAETAHGSLLEEWVAKPAKQTSYQAIVI